MTVNPWQPESEPSVTDTALVFEGGGMRAAFSAGIAITLIRAGIDFPHTFGVSAGSSTTANLVSRDITRARRSFVEFSTDPQFGSLRTFARGQGLFNAEYIYQNTALPDQALPLDWDTFCAHPSQVSVVAFNAEDGSTVEWQRADFPAMDDYLLRVRASSTMPIVMPVTDVDGTLYVDGALGDGGGIALPAMLNAGFDRGVFVLTQERNYRKPPSRFKHSTRQIFRRLPAVPAAMETRAQRYNSTRKQLFDLEADGKAFIIEPDIMRIGNSTRNLSQLAAAHRHGLFIGRRELPRLREFLGLPYA
ncbi:patatin family protein [Brevibacterium sp. HMSC063G07]|uniref:patatin-like phospholipase family protein n=1 Tax=Brevibacterium sp. HMSC063G07 TaxID=1739261 RepID=UPI0008A5F210|nr:patatin family protein [Brevibacterium sp. HMSC063G07]OFL65267.1 patatin family protein [Brevibacterium sp. HMSC063G07]